MTAILVQVSDAIAKELATLAFNEPVEIVRSYADFEDQLEDVDVLRIDVVPMMMDSEMVTRSKHMYKCTVSVLLRKRFSEKARTESDGRIAVSLIDDLVEHLQLITEYFVPSQPLYDGHRLADVPTAMWVKDSVPKAMYSRPMLREYSQFSGWIQLVYDVPRTIP